MSTNFNEATERAAFEAWWQADNPNLDVLSPIERSRVLRKKTDDYLPCWNAAYLAGRASLQADLDYHMHMAAEDKKRIAELETVINTFRGILQSLWAEGKNFLALIEGEFHITAEMREDHNFYKFESVLDGVSDALKGVD